MQTLELIGIVVVMLAIVAAYLALDRMADRWFASLPERIRKRGLLGLLIDRLRGRGGPT